jgi:hypothetical protein
MANGDPVTKLPLEGSPSARSMATCDQRSTTGQSPHSTLAWRFTGRSRGSPANAFPSVLTRCLHRPAHALNISAVSLARNRPGERAGDVVFARCNRGSQRRHRHFALVTADHRQDTAVRSVQHARGPGRDGAVVRRRGQWGRGVGGRLNRGVRRRVGRREWRGPKRDQHADSGQSGITIHHGCVRASRGPNPRDTSDRHCCSFRRLRTEQQLIAALCVRGPGETPRLCGTPWPPPPVPAVP